jgi:hypothetical protein
MPTLPTPPPKNGGISLQHANERLGLGGIPREIEGCWSAFVRFERTFRANKASGKPAELLDADIAACVREHINSFPSSPFLLIPSLCFVICPRARKRHWRHLDRKRQTSVATESRNGRSHRPELRFSLVAKPLEYRATAPPYSVLEIS